MSDGQAGLIEDQDCIVMVQDQGLIRGAYHQDDHLGPGLERAFSKRQRIGTKYTESQDFLAHRF